MIFKGWNTANVLDGFPFQKVAIFSELEHSFLQLKSRNFLFLFKNPELFVVSSSSQSRQILVKSQLKVYSVAYFLIAKLDIKCFFPICHCLRKTEIRLLKGNATDVAFDTVLLTGTGINADLNFVKSNFWHLMNEIISEIILV